MPRKLYYTASSNTVNKQTQIITVLPLHPDMPAEPSYKGEIALKIPHLWPDDFLCDSSPVHCTTSLSLLTPLSSTLPSVMLCSCQSQLPQQHWCLSILGECRHTPKLLNGQAKNSSGWIWLGWFMRLWVIQLCRGVRRAREWSEWALKEKK